MAVESDTEQRIARLTPLAEVLARIDELVKPVAARASDRNAATGRVLADDIVIETPVPAVARALRDGWAVRSELTSDAGAYAPAPISTAMRIGVGEPLPPDADAVAPVDAMMIRAGMPYALATVGPGDGVLPAGADCAAGATLLRAGRRLDAVAVALLGAIGVGEVRIRVPRVRIVRARPGRDAVIDAAVACIADAVEHRGGDPVMSASSELADASAEADAVVVVGGTGTGGSDATVRTLASLGQVHVHGVALLPAETTAFGTLGARPVLAVAGRLDAALAAWHVLGQVMLARLAGGTEELRTRRAVLTHKVTSMVGLAELVPVRSDGASATPIASGYVPLSALAQTDGWILIKPESEGYPAHSEVVIRPWP